VRILRGIAILLPQLIILLDAGARSDLLFGFNRTDAGLTSLLFLIIAAPVVTLVWFIVETISSVRLAKRQERSASFLLPALAFFFFSESLAIDVYLVLHFRM
jgi:hypothetical protein